ncbi:MAG TPA: hypothetical protein VF198_02900 [Vicinamibacterales bacterium]
MSRLRPAAFLLGGLLGLSAMLSAASPLQPPSMEPIERLLEDVAAPFARRAAAVRQLETALASETDAERAGALALLHLRALRWLLASVPMDGSRREPYRSWLTAHEALAVYNEPGGQWILSADWLWSVHDRHRATAAAEPIAWLAIENGLPGECEGYAPCYAFTLDRLSGEYLRRHPDGPHAADAADRIRAVLDEALRLQADPELRIDVSQDCADLVKSLDALRSALIASTAETRGAALASVDALRTFCP